MCLPIRDFRRDQSGQGLVEYALMLFLVALVVFAAIRALGPKTGTMVTEASQVFETAGADASTPPVESGKPDKPEKPPKPDQPATPPDQPATPPGKPATPPGKPANPGKP